MSSKKGKQGTAAAVGFSDLQQWLNDRLSVVGREVAGVAEQIRRVERKVDRVEEKMKEFHENLDEERDVMDEQFDKLRKTVSMFSDRVDQQFAVGDNLTDLCSQIMDSHNEQHMKQEVIIEFLRNEMMLEGARSAMVRVRDDMSQMKSDMEQMRGEWRGCRGELRGCEGAMQGISAGVADMVGIGQQMGVGVRDSIRTAIGDEMRESDERWKGMIRDVKGRLEELRRELRAGVKGSSGGLDGTVIGEQRERDTMSDVCSAAATELAAEGGGAREAVGVKVHGVRRGGGSQYFAVPPVQ